MTDDLKLLERIMKGEKIGFYWYTPSMLEALNQVFLTQDNLTCEQIFNFAQLFNFNFLRYTPIMLNHQNFANFKKAKKFLEMAITYAIKYSNPLALEWTILSKCGVKKHKPQLYKPTPMCSCPDCMEKLNQIASGSYKQQAETLASTKEVRDLTTKDLGFIFWANEHDEKVEILFYDKEKNAVWVKCGVPVEGTYIFDGKAIKTLPVKRLTDSNCIESATSIDDYAVLWSGKHKHMIVQRFNHVIHFMVAHYETFYGSYFMDTNYWFEMNGLNEALQLFESITASKNFTKLKTAWYDPKYGIIMRKFFDTNRNDKNKLGFYSLGIDGTDVIGGKYERHPLDEKLVPIKNFKTEEQAILFLNSLELKYLKEGFAYEHFFFAKSDLKNE